MVKMTIEIYRGETADALASTLDQLFESVKTSVSEQYTILAIVVEPVNGSYVAFVKHEQWHSAAIRH